MKIQELLCYVILIGLFVYFIGEKKKDEVNSEYVRGFFNAMAIISERGMVKGVDNKRWPYWEECKRSYLENKDLYNNWDTSYLNNQK